MRARMLLIMEAQVPDLDTASEEMQLQLDAFREATQPNERGISLFRAFRPELEEFARNGALLPDPGVLVTDKEPT